ncbi:TRAF2 and NCK-interacting protein kinase [Thelohanellus kitauei]|uniref:non-specific serine/threonine protein kinase n=1 Tax=Thelohanellus kitauei TaxID=669202 RepID=A0A0C2MZQ6_THEKT|nr:TRAF2 and NCK-interacting protein kinase [Thelohanellus kitauei]
MTERARDEELLVIYENLTNPDKLFKINDILGYGTYGHVFVGIHKSTQLEVAIKIVKVSQNRWESPLREIQILKMCSKHEGICKILGAFGKKSNTDQLCEVWIVMELCSGGSLQNFIALFNEENKPIPEHFCRYIIKDLLEAVKYLHNQSIIHRDIKSSNILFTGNGVVKLVDFGSSIKVNPDDKITDVVGTPFWMAPEVILCNYNEHASYCSKADIWSLGIVFIHLLDGRLPKFKPTQEPLNETLIDSSAIQKLPKTKRSRHCISLTRRFLILNPKQRPTVRDILSHEFFDSYSQEYKFSKFRIVKILKRENKSS